MNRAQEKAFKKWCRKGFLKTTITTEDGGAVIKRARLDECGKKTGRFDFKVITENGAVENKYLQYE